MRALAAKEQHSASQSVVGTAYRLRLF